MRKIRDVLRLKLEAKLSHQQIADALDISKGVVTKHVTLAKTANLDWARIQQLDDTALHNQLLAIPQRASAFVQPDYGRIHQELRRKGMTLMLLWQEHRAQYDEQTTYRYTQFCELYRRYAKSLKRSNSIWCNWSNSIKHHRENRDRCRRRQGNYCRIVPIS